MQMLKAWSEKRAEQAAGEISEEEYRKWKSRFQFHSFERRWLSRSKSAEVRVNQGFWAMLPGAFSVPETLEYGHLE